jgi:hypothetical protein
LHIYKYIDPVSNHNDAGYVNSYIYAHAVLYAYSDADLHGYTDTDKHADCHGDKDADAVDYHNDPGYFDCDKD